MTFPNDFDMQDVVLLGNIFENDTSLTNPHSIINSFIETTTMPDLNKKEEVVKPEESKETNPESTEETIPEDNEPAQNTTT